jgi:predicted transcriptional regulator
MSDQDPMTTLRTLVRASDLHLTQISTRSSVPYGTLYRAIRKGKSLNVDAYAAVYQVLTGNSLVATTTIPVDEH